MTYFFQARLLPPPATLPMESSESTPPSISPPQHTYQLQVPAGLPEEITAYYKLHQPLCGSLQSARVHLDPMLLSPSSKAINPDDPHSILICNDCHRSLSTICLIFLLFKLNHAILTHVLLGSTSSKNPDAPPRFAIAHGLFAGIFPHQLRAATTAVQFTTRLLETSSSAELSSTIGIATSLNSHRNYNNLRYADFVAAHREKTQQSPVFAAPADIRSNNTIMSNRLRRYIEANVAMIKHSAPLQPIWPGTKSQKRTFTS